MGFAQVFGNGVLSQLEKLYLMTVESGTAITEAERERNKTTRELREEDRKSRETRSPTYTRHSSDIRRSTDKRRREKEES